MFEPENLSPQSIEPIECDLPYGLTWEDLWPILSGFDLKSQYKARALIFLAKQGLNGGDNSLILTIQYPAVGKTQKEITIFIKQITDPKKAEADKYRFLETQDIPIPRLLAKFQKDETEIIILEFLPVIGIDFHSTCEVESLLQTVAKLNAVPKPTNLFDSSPGLPEDEFDELVRSTLVTLAQNEVYKVDALHWFNAYLVSQKATKVMPLAVNHNELFFQQVGWVHHRASRELVLFDLETMCVSPRFTDIANILYPLSISTRLNQIDLFKYYLERLSAFNHTPLELNASLRELKLLRITNSCYSIPWLVDEARQPNGFIYQEGLNLIMDCLRDDLTSLELI